MSPNRQVLSLLLAVSLLTAGCSAGGGAAAGPDTADRLTVAIQEDRGPIPVLQGALLLVTLGIIVANLLADLTYPLLDPRVRRASPAPADDPVVA